MLFTIGLCLTLTAVLAVRMRRPRPRYVEQLGWMSQQWLTEHRASQASPML